MFSENFGHLISILTLVLLLVMFLSPFILLTTLYIRNSRQTKSSLLRGKYWFVGILRYVIEKVGPEFRFYITDDDNMGKPISRIKFVTIVKAAKYLQTLISYGSKRDFLAPGIYIKNSMFPKLNSELELDNSHYIQTRKYNIDKETLFLRYESVESVDVRPRHLTDSNAVVVGPGRQYPWRIKGLVGMSGMSYGALGPSAITALSKGIGMAGGSWMNTGEGGLSPYHLEGGCDIVYQIGPGMFGVRTQGGEIDWALVREKAAVTEVKAFELKLGQGAKIRGGHVEGVKVTPEIAAIRGVEPWKTIDSPNRFQTCHGAPDLFDLVMKIQEETGLPVGIKIVVGDNTALDDICEEYKKRGGGPDFITVDGGEGGTGATYKEMADSLGLPIYSAIVIADNALRKNGLRDKVKLIASGRLHLPDEQAVALGLGADLIAGARSFMISVGCIMAEQCHSNECPVGVATTNKKLQRLLFVDEKKYRTLNYLITVRVGLFALSAACGLTSPTQFTREHLVFKDDRYRATNCAELFPYPK
ncbi:Ferredoxin-dependent glutamate synthase [hydrothermal vent metagenome]|uniref:Ferredoxin-dependent glutamate synthase n=1 Tax=hydrothermal vent metagenome TaxID=652676 RepID=A0A3B1CJK4_9ZZZZ